MKSIFKLTQFLLIILLSHSQMYGYDGVEYPDCQRHFGERKINSMNDFYSKYPEFNPQNNSNYISDTLLSKFSVENVEHISLLLLLSFEKKNISTIEDLEKWTELVIKLLLSVGERKNTLLVQIIGHFIFYAEEILGLDKYNIYIKKTYIMFLDLADALLSNSEKFKTKLLEDSRNQRMDRIFEFNKHSPEYWSMISLKFFLDNKFFDHWLGKIINPTQNDYDELRHISHSINNVFLNNLSAKHFKERVTQIELKLIKFYQRDIHQQGFNSGNILGLLEISDTHGKKSNTIRRLIAQFLNPLYQQNIQIPSISDIGTLYLLKDFQKMQRLHESSIFNGWIMPTNQTEVEMRQRIINFSIQKNL